jgi:hypothetical protein
MIPKSECVNRTLYRIHSRNLTHGVYRAETGGFLGLREKLGSIYVFEEYHLDNGPYSTVHPLEALPEVLPPEIQLVDGLGTECLTCGVSSSYVRWPEGGKREVTLKRGGTMQVAGLWTHLAETGCDDVRPVGVTNAALHAWLEAMEKKYLRKETK